MKRHRQVPTLRGRRRGLRPFHQGELDGLCGVYAVINAVRALCPELTADDAAWIFGSLISVLAKAGTDAVEATTYGIERAEVGRLLRWTRAHVLDEYGVGLTVRRLPRPLRHQVGLATLWQALARAITPSSVAVLGLAGRQSHWTVAIGVTPRQIRLFDSCKMRVLHRRHCRAGRANLRNGISAPCVFIIKRRPS